MAKWISDTVIDAALNYIKSNATKQILCSAQPSNYAEALSYALATKTGLTSGSFSGPVDGDVSGRKITASAQNSASVVANGTATHVALCTDSALLLVTTCTSQAVTSGISANMPAFDYEIEDPT